MGKEVPYPFHTVHIHHKGPMNHMSDGKHHCLVVIDALSHFIQVYPVKSSDATHTIEAMSTSITSFVIPQKLVHDRGTSFMSTDFSIFLLEFGITHAPRTNCHLGPMGELKYRINIWVDISVVTYLKLETIGPNWLVNLRLHIILQ